MRSCTALFALAFTLLLPVSASAQHHAGREAIERFGCASCHTIPGVEVETESSCVGCHTDIAARSRGGLGSGPRVTSFLHTPDLTRVTRRLSTDYLVRFVQDPHDVRPRLAESMPRLPVGARDARHIVDYLRASAPSGASRIPETPAPNVANVARGREVFVGRCSSCHSYGNVAGIELPAPVVRGMGPAAVLAPNLRFVRDRMDPDLALIWIQNPRAVDPDTHMEKPDVSRADALAVRDFLFLGDPGRPVRAGRAPTAEAITPLDRRVRFGEVRRILGRSCIHCHAHTQDSDTTTGLGFEARALDLSTWEGVRAGVLEPDGSRRSIVDSGPDGALPPLVARLLVRHAEAERDVVERRADTLRPALRARRDPGPVGMPLGLPPVPLDDIRIVATWIAAGTPR